MPRARPGIPQSPRWCWPSSDDAALRACDHIGCSERSGGVSWVKSRAPSGSPAARLPWLKSGRSARPRNRPRTNARIAAVRRSSERAPWPKGRTILRTGQAARYRRCPPRCYNPSHDLVGGPDPCRGRHVRHGRIHRSDDLDGRSRSRQLWLLTSLTCRLRKFPLFLRHCGGFHCVNGLPAAAHRTSTSVVPGFARCAQLSDVSNCQSPQIPSTFDRNCRM